jgi:hypothetical protein
MIKLNKINIVYFILVLTTILAGCSIFNYKQLPESKGLIIELDASGKEIWRTTEFRSPGCYNKTIKGHKLISDNYARFIYEFDQNGQLYKLFRDYANVYIAKTAENTYLLAHNCCNLGVKELDRFGQTLWEMKEIEQRGEIYKLTSGHYLVADVNRGTLRVYNKEKVILKEIQGDFVVNSVQPLDNERFLIADRKHNRIIEIDSTGTEYWQMKNFVNEPLIARKTANNLYVIYFSNSSTYVLDSKKQVLFKLEKFFTINITILPDGHTGIAGYYW